MKLYHLTCAAVLALAPLTAMAQSTVGPSVDADHQKNANDMKTGSAANSSTAPGATGKTVVPGSKSTVESDHTATTEQKKGDVSGGKQ